MLVKILFPDGRETSCYMAHHEYVAAQSNANVTVTVLEFDPVTPRQLRLALLQIGITPTDVEEAISLLDEPQRTAAMIEWEYALEIKRDHPLINTLAEIWNQTDADVDALFLAASELT